MVANKENMELSDKNEKSALAGIVRTRNRTLHILLLFETRPLWTVEEIAAEMGVSISSAYRDVKELSSTGFLAPSSRSQYMLGPAFIRYDLLMRQGDPLVTGATELMRTLLSETTQHGVVLISRRFRDQVMCVHQERGSSHSPASTYQRGVALPMFKGATSKAILAHIGDRALKQMYLDHEQDIKVGAGFESWKSFANEMAAIREAGFALTDSEVAAGRTGIAAPVFADGQVVAGVSLVIELRRYDKTTFTQAVKACAQAISDSLSAAT